MSTETFGARLRRLRRAKGWTQEELSDHSGVKRSTIGLYESGAIKGAGAEAAHRLAAALGVDSEHLVFGKDDNHSPTTDHPAE